MSRMHNPPHPGEILRELYLEPLGVGVGEFAESLGVHRTTLSQLVNERRGISADMALRLSQALQTTPDVWLGHQAEYDLAHARKSKGWKKVKKVVGTEAA